MFQPKTMFIAFAMILALASIMSSNGVTLAERLSANMAVADLAGFQGVGPGTHQTRATNFHSHRIPVVPAGGPVPGRASTDQFPYAPAGPLPPLSILPGDEWRYFKGTVAPPLDWTSIGFDDLSWEAGNSGIGYGDGDDATILADMQHSYSSVFLRRTFVIVDPSTVTSLLLSVDYDDGFVAYLNGTEVARSNVAGSPPAFNALATASHEASGGNTTVNPVGEFDISAFINVLVAGDNVLALQGHNLTLGSSDFSLIPTLIWDGDDDADADGVADGSDLCPDTPAGESVDADGCSNSQLDADADGVNDANDLCPGTPAGESVDADGCSEGQLNPTLVGYWTFDEVTGDALDSSGNDNHGTLESFPLGHAGPMRVPGHLGNAVSFDGINDLVRVADNDTLDFGEGEDFSISLWFRDPTAEPGNTANAPELLEKQNALDPENSPFYQVRSPDANQTLKVQVDDGIFQDSFNTTLGGELADGEWHHLVVVRDYDVGISGYVDGTMAGSDPSPSAGSLVNDGDLLFGGGNLTGHTPGFYNGELDEVRIYRKALNDAEIAVLFSGEPVTDGTPPVVTITTPSDGSIFSQNDVVLADYECADEAGGSGIASCNGDVPPGDPIATGTVGPQSFTVTGTDNAGNTTMDINGYTVISEALPIQAGDEWRYLKGTVAPPPDWNTNGFDDSSWAVGPSGFGYGDGDDATILADMQNGYSSVFVRHTFGVVDPGILTGLLLTVDYDDGFAAYLNGVEVARSNVAGFPPAFNALATASHEASGGNTTVNPVAEFDIASFIGLLVEGDNVLALQGHNLTLGSSDFSLIPSLIGDDTVIDLTPPVVTITSPSDGASLSQDQVMLADYTCTDETDGSGIATCDGDVAVGAAIDTATPGSKSFAVTGTDTAGNPTTVVHQYTVSSAPLPILPLPILAGDEWRYFKGTVEPPADWRLDGFDDLSWHVGPTGIGYSDDDDATVLTDMEDNYTSVYLRKTFSVADHTAVTSLLLSVDYDDGFIAYLNGTEVGRANITEISPAYDALADSDHEASGGVHNDPQPPVQINISFPDTLLVTGDNVLALQGHNKSLSSSDFTLIPILSQPAP